MKIIGVTGTVGKTSTILYLEHYLMSLNYRVASASTDGLKINGKVISRDNEYSCLFEDTYFNYIKTCNKENIDYAIMELTAEVNHTNFYNNKQFDLIVLTNILPGVCQSFSSDDEYFRNKLDLLRKTKSTRLVVNNTNDVLGNSVYNMVRNKGIVTTFNTEEIKDDFNISNIPLHQFSKHITDNLLCVYSILQSLNIYVEPKFNELYTYCVNGRYELFDCNDKHFLIDSGYNGIEGLDDIIPNIYKTAQINNNKVYCVLCTYDFGRDNVSKLVETYREQKGLFFKMYTDYLYLTDYEKWRDDETSSIKSLTRFIDEYEYIKHREDAIKEVLQKSSPNDYVLLVGKGSELIKTSKGNMSEKEIILNYFK